MPFRFTMARCSGLLLVFALLMASMPHVTHAQGTPAPAGSNVTAMECGITDPICEEAGALIEFLAHGRSADMTRAWVLARVTLQTDAVAAPETTSAATHYTVYVEQGTIGLTASVPVTCIGECHIEASGTIEATTPEPGSVGGVLVPAGTEVILSPGDVATFESREESTHVYRNAGETDAKIVSSLSGPSLLVDGRCRGRCLDGF